MTLLVLAVSVVGCGRVLCYDPEHEGRRPPVTRRTSVPRPRDTVRVRAVRVVDGDTLVVSSHGRPLRLRLIGVDAPELPRTYGRLRRSAGAEGCAGRAAERALSKLIRAGAVLHVASDREPFDPYGRRLGYVWTDEGADPGRPGGGRHLGVFVNAALIRSGHARAVVIEPNDRFAAVLAAAETASAPGTRARGMTCT